MGYLFVPPAKCRTVFLIAAFCSCLTAQTNISLSFNNVGPSSLLVNGTQMLAYGNFRLDGLTFQTPSGQQIAGDLTGTLSVNQQTVTWTASWGTITTNYAVAGSQVNVTVTVNNQSPNTIADIWMEPLGIQFPSTPQEYLYPLVVNSIGQPAIQQTTYNSGVMVLAANDITKPIQLGFPWPLNSPTNTVFPLQLNTGLVSMYPNQYQAINRPIAAGGSDTFAFSLRFGPPGSTEETLAPDIYRAFAAAFPMQLNWPDRRAIGALFLSTSAAGYATNPRGWLLDPTIDVFTPDGVANLKSRILAYAATSVGILQGMNAQGMITWDIEGQQFAQPISYVGDPTQFMATAPEMAGIADAYFKTFTDAGLRVGVCLRPQQFVLSPDGSSAQQVFVTDPNQVTQLLMNKAAYAINRWGASLFYVDSNVNLTDPNPIPASIFQTLQAAFPGVLFLPEHSDMQYYAYTAPYKQLNQGYTSTPPDVRAAYPKSFEVIYTADGPIAQDFSTLVTSVSQGDALLFRGWFNDPQNAQDLSIYQQAGSSGSVHQPPAVSLTSPANGSTVSGNITMSATATASSGAAIASVQFQVDGNTVATVSSSPYNATLNTAMLTNGGHVLTAVAVDSFGSTAAATATVTVSNSVPPPVVSITSPANGSTISGSVTVAASGSASGTATIASVQFQVDGNTIGSVSAAPYSISFNTTNLANGNHTLTAVAKDSLGNTGIASITVTVNNVVPPPAVSFTSPANGSTVSGSVNVAVSASASGTATIASVQFQVDGNTIGTVSAAPYSISFNTPSFANGSHTLAAVAKDSLGNTGSASITVTVNNAVPPPTVSFTSPTNGSTVSGSVNVAVSASASGTATIAGVQFQVDGNSIGTVSAAPYSISLNTANFANGTHTLTAIAKDSLGNSGSASITVIVNSVVTTPSNGYSYQRTITISAAQVPNTDQVNFPVLIEGVYPYLANVANGGRVQNANGYDMVFSSDSAGANLLNWEIESYNPATGAIVLWVQAPLVSHSANTVFYLSYGNGAISAFQGNKNGTWDSNYVAVYHMSDNAATSVVTDSTANGNNGAAQAPTNSKTATGAIGGALAFNGSTDWINCGAGLPFAITGPITFEAWVNTTGLPGVWNQAYVLGKGYNGSNEGYFLRLETDTNNVTSAEAGTFTFPTSYESQAPVSNFTGGWHHLVGTFDASWSLYVDGVKTPSTQAQPPFSSASEPFIIGARDSTLSTKSFLTGMIDEVRISSIARSPDWIVAEYNNQSQPSQFYTIGAEAGANN